VLGWRFEASLSHLDNQSEDELLQKTGSCLITRASRSAATAQRAESITSAMASGGASSSGAVPLVVGVCPVWLCAPCCAFGTPRTQETGAGRACRRSPGAEPRPRALSP
jgi:hypothetical protein